MQKCTYTVDGALNNKVHAHGVCMEYNQTVHDELGILYTSLDTYQSGKLPRVVTKIKWPPTVPKMDTGTTGRKYMLPEKF